MILQALIACTIQGSPTSSGYRPSHMKYGRPPDTASRAYPPLSPLHASYKPTELRTIPARKAVTRRGYGAHKTRPIGRRHRKPQRSHAPQPRVWRLRRRDIRVGAASSLHRETKTTLASSSSLSGCTTTSPTNRIMMLHFPQR